MFKRANVVILSNKTKHAKVGELSIQKNYTQDRLVIVNKNITEDYLKYFIKADLYILSDENPAEGDWVLNTASPSNRPFQIDKIGVQYVTESKTTTKKIIATTDESLNIMMPNIDAYEAGIKTISLPKPSDSFIKKYIEEYNKGNQITDVMIEYSKEWVGKDYVDDMDAYVYDKFEEILKVSSDNTITIRKVKDGWSREETYNLLIDLWATNLNKREEVENWIKENL